MHGLIHFASRMPLKFNVISAIILVATSVGSIAGINIPEYVPCLLFPILSSINIVTAIQISTRYSPLCADRFRVHHVSQWSVLLMPQLYSYKTAPQAQSSADFT